ncbi:MAG TPA: MarR family transcriptional regulator [Aggregatilineaceae bacterium]|nr:MarR family transcriptional regulator [Aggregatilineaceae bacterium]
MKPAIQRRYRPSVLSRLHLARLHSRLVHDEQNALQPYGLTAAQFDVLSRLATEPGLNQQMLADRLLVTKGNICGLIDRLELAGLVERRNDPQDRRTYHLHLTLSGVKLFEQAAPALEEAIGRQFELLNDDEMDTLLTLLAKLDRALR